MKFCLKNEFQLVIFYVRKNNRFSVTNLHNRYVQLNEGSFHRQHVIANRWQIAEGNYRDIREFKRALIGDTD